MKKRGVSEGVHPIGMFRVQITEDGDVVGDSGWRANMITNLGARDYLVDAIVGDAGALTVSHLAIGTGTAPASDATVLAGELGTRVAVSTSIISSRTAQFTCQFASSVFSGQGAQTIQNLGLFNSESTGTLFAGNTYTTSQWNTNQDVNATYQIKFATA